LTTPDSTKTYHNHLKKFFEITAQKKACETKFVQRDSPLNGQVFLTSLVLTVFQYGTIVLDQLAKAAHTINPEISITGQAFKERFNAFAVEFLKAMFAEALKLTVPATDRVLPLLEVFSAVYLLDSSVVTLPDTLKDDFRGCGGAGAKAAAKVFLLFNWLNGVYETLRIDNGCQPDQKMGQEFIAGRATKALWIFDLGFFNATFMSAIAKAQSFFLSRLAASQLIFWAPRVEGALERLDLDLLLSRSARELFEIEVVFGPKQEVRTRLIIAPVPKEVANARRRRAREAARKQGRTPTKTTLDRCDWTLLLTNASAEQLPTSTVLEVYRVRWQVELVFKLFKSDAKLETTNAREKNRVKCELYAKFIAALLFNRICHLAEELALGLISPAKLWRRMRNDAQDWLCVFGQGTAVEISELLKFLARYAVTSQRKKYPSTLQRLERAGKQARQVELKDPLGYLQKKRTAAERKKAFADLISSRKVKLDPERLSYQRTTLTP
jgi:Transposase DDE domain